MRLLSAPSEARAMRLLVPAVLLPFAVVLPTTGVWSSQPTPSISNDPATLYSVSCTSSTWCMAVGAYSVRAGGSDVWNPIVEHWSGGSWTRMHLPAWSSSLQDVSCVSTAFCVAVGGTVSLGLVATWNGKAWTAHWLGDTLLNGVSCVSSTWCRAAGSETNVTEGRLPILTWNGSRWGTTIDDAPAGAMLTSIDCPTEHVCVAIGSRSSQGSPVTLAQMWVAGHWRELTVPHDTETELYAVDCARSTHCVAVGTTTSVPNRTLVEVWNGVGWSPEKSPDNSTLSDNLLQSVTCSATDRCVAVGWAEDAYQTREAPLIETWNRAHWALSGNARVGDARLWGVSCPNTGTCRAVGDRGLPKYRTFAESGTP